MHSLTNDTCMEDNSADIPETKNADDVILAMVIWSVIDNKVSHFDCIMNLTKVIILTSLVVEWESI